MEPISIVLHFDYRPYDEASGEGMEPSLIAQEVGAVLQGLMRAVTPDLRLVWTEIIEPAATDEDGLLEERIGTREMYRRQEGTDGFGLRS